MSSLGTGGFTGTMHLFTLPLWRKNWIEVIEHPDLFTGFGAGQLLSVPSVKRELTCKILTQETFKKEWEGNVRTLSVVDFTTAFR
jgi:hypothetical protein